MIVYTVLGSCVSACIRDPLAGVGGMNHFMLPKPKEAGTDSWGESTRYGSYAMESLINEILKRGGVKSRLEVKLFGAGRIYEGNIDVGARNAEWVLEYVRMEGLTACKTDLGDVLPRKIYYFTESGRVLMKKIEKVKNDTIVTREREYASKIARKEIMRGGGRGCDTLLIDSENVEKFGMCHECKDVTTFGPDNAMTRNA